MYNQKRETAEEFLNKKQALITFKLKKDFTEQEYKKQFKVFKKELDKIN